jgi:fructokinase
VEALDVLCLGELLIDFVSDTPGADLGGSHGFIKAPGGAPANVAVGVQRLGGRAGFVGCVGDDPFGRFLRDVLAAEGVDTSPMTFSREFNTTLAFVSRRLDGEREFSFYRGADSALRAEDVADATLRQARILHCCSVSMSRQPARDASFSAMQRAAALGTLVSFDPNLRPPLWESLEDAKACCLRGLELAQIVKVSEEEAQWLAGLDDLAAAAAALWRPQMHLLAVTLGAGGARYHYAGGAGEVGAPRVQAIDTTGAGDAFCAGLLSALRDAGAPVETLSPAQIEAALRFANACGALTTTRPGAIPALPTRAEIAALLGNRLR